MNKKWLLLFLLIPALLLAFWQVGIINHNDDEADNDMNGTSSTDIVSKEYEIEVLAEGLEIPWEIVPLPDGRVIITERPGRIVMLGVGEIATIQNVEHIGEGGLLGMVLSPNFSENNYVYIYYTYREGSQIYNRVSRLTLLEETLFEETVIIDEIPGARVHNGGRIKFGPDDKLYVTTGDAQQPSLSQDLESLAGKILRLNEDGSIPEDNPLPDSPIYAYGLRNPQGLAWQPESGQLFASDHGPTMQDEINIITPGANYGWPIVSCSDWDNEYEYPFICYLDFTLAPSGMDFYKTAAGETMHSLYVAGLRGNMIMRINIDSQTSSRSQTPILQDWGRLRTVVYHEGALYIATNNRDGRGVPSDNNDKVLKVTRINE
ncbi:PQQ-dependent sugar dehydrogenase [Desulfuribacillus alkaliarsenatis]|nr:PQQ-dependent sugar dehydrogenase [Desulfuribacillus alkaliarsenatis]